MRWSCSTSKWRNGNTPSNELWGLKSTRQRTLHAKSWENSIVLGRKKSVRNNFQILDFVQKKKVSDEDESWKLPFSSPNSCSFEHAFAGRDDQNLLQDWRGEFLSTAHVLRQTQTRCWFGFTGWILRFFGFADESSCRNMSLFLGPPSSSTMQCWFRLKQRMEASCLCWQFFHLVFTEQLPRMFLPRNLSLRFCF